ncbi:hypothetical protein WJX73_008341 [Symbiochloris irregularis]|uniref:ABC transporter domain-containing protein n=1 Tax=Symbiochloris irregularis TaxID=706552 RepID=A0AAW1P6T6_9CHLO
MGSLNQVWVPTLVLAHVCGVLLWFYAVTHLAGNKPKKKPAKQPKTPGTAGASGTSGYGQMFRTNELSEADEDTLSDKSAKHEADPAAFYELEDVDGMSSHARRTAVQPLPIELTWKDLEFSIRVRDAGKPKDGSKSKTRHILYPCSGRFQVGEAAAIMGPSGAGKSTLIDLLTGRKRPSGSQSLVSMNGHRIYQAMTRKYMSYVGQEDVFLPNLTAWESLAFYARLSLPEDITRYERRDRMETILETMGISKVRFSMVGGYMPGGVIVRGLSGGERRRLSVACGMIGNPSIMFLDEPTTGLDSHAALAMVNHLVALTRMGHTIACSIHQPRQEIFNAFDSITMLSEGYQVYQQSPKFCCEWFNGGLGYVYVPEEDGTVADWVISLVSVRFQNPASAAQTRYMASLQELERAAASFVSYSSKNPQSYAMSNATSSMPEDLQSDQNDRNPFTSLMTSIATLLSTQRRNVLAETAAKLGTPFSQDVAQPSEHQYNQSWGVQFLMLTRRALRTQLRNPSESSLRLVVGTWIGLLAGLVYIRLPDNPTSAQPRASTIFFMLMLNAITPISYMAFYNSDKRFFEMDSANGIYSASAYYAAASAAGTPFVILNTCAGGLMAYGLAGLRDDARAILIFMAILSLQALTANQFFVTIIWLSPTQDTAYAVATTYLTFSLLLCGFYVAIPNMVLSFTRGLSWASFSKYTFEALMANEFVARIWTQPCQSRSGAILIGGAQPLCDTAGESILQYLGLHLGVFKGAIILFAFYIAFHITAFWALLRLFKIRRQ